MRESSSRKKHAIPLLIIIIITFAVYLNTLQAGFLAVDDVDTIRHIQSGNVSVSGLFFQRGSEYFRPIAILSLLLDFTLFGGNPAGYHLANILIHLANSILVYFLATLFLGSNENTPYYSFLAALLFALHPVNSEAVVWMSARPDLLCCLFFQLCLILLLKRSTEITPLVFTGLFLTFFCSLASKEASLFLPALAIIYCIIKRKTVPLKSAITACTALLLAAAIYLLLRKGLPVALPATAGVAEHPENFVYSLFLDGITAYGFYIWKLFYPFPLNIAITHIPTIACLGIFVMSAGLAAFLWKRNPDFKFPIAFLFLSIVPPLGALFLSIAWTAYAERYLYIPSVAFALCTILFLRQYLARLPRIIPIACMLLMAIPTAHRVNLWTMPISFWQDAVAKSPDFGTLRLPLAAEYIEAKRYEEAESTLRQANDLGLPRKSARNFAQELRILLDEKKSTSRSP